MPRPGPSERDRSLLRIAGAIADREAVAWDDESVDAPRSPSGPLSRLRSIAALAAVYDRARAGMDDPGAGAATEGGGRVVGGTWGPLRILEVLGRGGFADVYRAFDPRLDREVALKLWRRRSPEDTARQLAEARTLASLRHPNLPVVHGIDEHDGQLGMWTERVRGSTLEERLEAEGPLDGHAAVAIGVELCRALAVMHDAGLVHRDVTLANIMCEPGGRVVLVDVGLVATANAQEIAAAGTPPYMAPELLSGGVATPASDVFAVGVTLHRLVTGAFPYDDARTPAELLERRKYSALPLGERRPDLPAGFVHTVERALATDAAARPRDARALEAALLEIAPPRPDGWRASVPAAPRDPPRLLPRQATRFIGRDDALWNCLETIRSSPLVTLVGPGGSGKTRLAIRAAEQMAERGEWTVGFADFSTCSEPSTLGPEVMRALDLPPARGRDPHARLAETIGAQPTLLVADNCEHVVGAARALLGPLLDACPGLRILATSREPLRLPGERLLEVTPLALPPEGAVTAAALQPCESVRLFVDRATMVRADFRLTDRNAPAVAEICRRADGLPLVIELAAARARALTPEEIRDRFTRDLMLHDRGGFTTSDRHRTLEHAIRWSYDALPPETRAFADALAIFAGSWTLEAAERVCLDPSHASSALERTVDLLERSMIVTAPERLGVSRYRYLETLRRFMLDRLRESGLLGALQQRLFDHMLALAEQAAPGLWGSDQATWAERLDAEHANLLAGLAWSREQPRGAVANLRLAGALARFWSERGHLVGGLEALEWAIEHASPEDDAAAYARALFGAGTLAAYRSEHGRATEALERALEIHRRLGDDRGAARDLLALGVVANDLVDYSVANERYREALALFRDVGETRGVAHVLNNMGGIAWRQGRWDEARGLHEEALRHAVEANDPSVRSLSLTNLGLVLLHSGGMQRAATRIADALVLVRVHGLRRLAPATLETAAAILARMHESSRAARLYAAAETLRSRLGNPREPAWVRAHEPMVDAIARDLGPGALERERAAGQALPMDAAIDEARQGLGLAVPGA